MEEEKKEGATLPVLYFITVAPVVNVDHPSYRDVLWINYVYDNYTFNRHYGPKVLYNYFLSVWRRDYTVIKVELELTYYQVSYSLIRESSDKWKVTVVN